jgi:hypothetical protein
LKKENLKESDGKISKNGLAELFKLIDYKTEED